MFGQLSEKFQNVLNQVRGYGVITDENIKIPSLSPKTTSTPLNFLKFWEKRFNKAGHDSLRKISRLYSAI